MSPPLPILQMKVTFLPPHSMTCMMPRETKRGGVEAQKTSAPESGTEVMSFVIPTHGHSGTAGNGGSHIIHFLNFTTLPSTTAT